MWELNNDVNLLICQKSKVEDWVEHFQKYYQTDFLIFNLTNKTDFAAFFSYKEQDKPYERVGIINYDLIFRRPDLLKLEDFTLMLDESSLIRNENAKRSKFVLKLKPESVILLSGTPTAGKYEKLWSQLKLLGWNISKEAFWKSYVVTEWRENDDGFMEQYIVGYKNVEHLKIKLSEHGAVFMKTDEVMDLPEQIEENIKVRKTEVYKKFEDNGYVQISKANMDVFHLDSDYWGSNESDCIELIGDNILTKMLYLRQLCGQYHKGKLQALRDLVESTEDRIIIFYNFTEELRMMMNYLDELKRPYSVLNGKKKDLKAYEECSDSITFIQYQAGAMGGNFQKANRIIYFTLPLGKGSCDLWEQSKKRIHRIGQERTCFYYYLLVSGSIEEKNFRMLKLGKELTDELFEKD